jgi:hypothetical protein
MHQYLAKDGHCDEPEFLGLSAMWAPVQHFQNEDIGFIELSMSVAPW